MEDVNKKELPKQAFVTLLATEDYLDAVLVLNESLKRTKNQYPLIAAITDSIFSYEILDTLQLFNIPYVVIPRLEYSKGTILSCQKRGWNTVLNTASKYSLFNLKYFDKLVYLDADSMVLQNIDDLMNYKDGSMLWDPTEKAGFSASYVFSPINHCIEMYNILSNNSLHVDGDLFSNLWFHLKDNSEYRIPLEYFEYFWGINKENLDRIKAVHFVNDKKPWFIKKNLYPFNNVEQENILDKYYIILNNIKEIKNERFVKSGL